ncbi:hypothetical protein HCU74_18415 [Spongiibacter sp. KMU-166]|uniref:Uncharacterized protein n=1 Tax=Spongiibacter thalassae TaxID=2721624 RepID=A0ABX1GJG6_9GAMM|nr:hypothetical protein [Spongiibacter thalassae]NKI19385.1 hypothetical protein [Spongiibacter thalassae]
MHSSNSPSALLHQLAFGLFVGGGLILLGLWLNTAEHDGFAAALVGALLLLMNTVQYLHQSGRFSRPTLIAGNALKGDAK